MKPVKSQKYSKGERLNWEPLSSVKSVKLTKELTYGRVLHQNTSDNSSSNQKKNNLFVP